MVVMDDKSTHWSFYIIKNVDPDRTQFQANNSNDCGCILGDHEWNMPLLSRNSNRSFPNRSDVK